MHLKGSFLDKQELSPGSDLAQAELPFAVFRADVVSARCFNLGLRHLQPIKRMRLYLHGKLYASLRALFGQTRVIPQKRPSASLTPVFGAFQYTKIYNPFNFS